MKRRTPLRRFHPKKADDDYYVPDDKTDEQVRIQMEHGIKPNTPKQKWFLERIADGNGVCEECGKPFGRGAFSLFAGQAHLLPQETFPSVALHPKNRIELGWFCQHHGQFDSSWLNASRMKVWPKAKKIILTILIPLLPQDEYRKLPNILRDEYEKV
jgi:hypothetical protein